MLDIMYEVPSCEDLEEVVITEAMVTEGVTEGLDLVELLKASAG
mgnify:CR=1 FL=1